VPCIIQFLPCRSTYDRISRIPPDKYRSQMRFVRSQVLSLRAVRDSTIEDSTNKKKSGVARFKRFVTKLACCVGMGDSERKFCESKCARIRFCPSGGEWHNRADCRLRRSMSCFASSPDRNSARLACFRAFIPHPIASDWGSAYAPRLSGFCGEHLHRLARRSGPKHANCRSAREPSLRAQKRKACAATRGRVVRSGSRWSSERVADA